MLNTKIKRTFVVTKKRHKSSKMIKEKYEL